MFFDAGILQFSRTCTVASVLALVSLPLLGAHGASTSPQEPICHTCSLECPYGSGYYCEPSGGVLGGTSVCTVSVSHFPDPVDPEGDGTYRGFCFTQGAYCWTDTGEIEYDRIWGPKFPEEAGTAALTLERQAMAVVAAGDMLPSDGPFYFGSAGDELVVRWKCDGRVAGRVAFADAQ